MSEKPICIPLSEFVEHTVARQRAHYDKVLADGIRRLDEMPWLDEETNRARWLRVAPVR